MLLVVVSFLAGALTVLAPCILPLLPIIIGGATLRTADEKAERRYLRPLVIVLSLALSVIVFTLLLKFSTSLLGVSPMVWQTISGVIVVAFGLVLLLPELWEKLMIKTNLIGVSNDFFGASQRRKGLAGDVTIGVALGPIFNSCSPTYALIVASVLPASFAEGFIYLVAYALGLASMLFLIVLGGQKVVSRLGWLANPNGWFRKVIAGLFIVTGLAVLFGLDKKVQTYVLDRGWYAPIADIEKSLR